MKILLMHSFYKIGGGADVFFFETKKILEAHGHSVACLSTIHANNEPSPYEEYFVSAPEFRSPKLLKRFGSIAKIVYSAEAKKKTEKLIRAFRPDIAHGFGLHTHLSPSVLDACGNAGVPVVLSCNDYKLICPNYKLYHHGRLCFDCKNGGYYHAVVNRCCHDSMQFSVASAVEAYTHKWMNVFRRNVHTFLFASDFMVKTTEQFWGKGSFRWKKLGNPFHSPTFQLSDTDKNYILYFGRFIEEKGVDILLHAMQELRDVKLIVIGNGPDESDLKALTKKLQLNNVEFVGPKWGTELDRYLADARFTVVPSIWHENFPYVIVQSFAMGKAVVGTDRGGIPELIRDHEFGRLSIGGDPKSLSRSIRELWDDPAACKRMGRNAKAYADAQFNYAKYYQDIMNIYEGVLA